MKKSTVFQIAPTLTYALMLLGISTAVVGATSAAIADLASVGAALTKIIGASHVVQLSTEPVVQLSTEPVVQLSTEPEAAGVELSRAAGSLTAHGAFVAPERAPQSPPPAPTFTVLEPTLDAPRCESVYVYIVTTFPDPKSNIATMASSKQARGHGRRVGARVGDYRVIAIGQNPERQSSAVWLSRDGQVCQALLRDDNPIREKAIKKARKRRAARYQTQKRKEANAERRKARKKPQAARRRSKRRRR